MLVYNTLTHKKQLFRPIRDRHVGLYTCGPTVYWFAHIGNMKAYVDEDIIKRVLIHKGYSVKHVMNITDVGHLVGDANLGEDKIVMEAKKEHKSAAEVAAFYTDAFLKDIERLNIIKPDVICKATDHIQDMLKLIKKLDEKGYLYRVETGIYYDTSKFKDYGRLTGMTFEQLNKYLKAGARVERAKGIRNITDFAVWRFASGKEREMVWQSEWGEGFPGWHIECSAMSMKYLGEHFDIHMGGVDHIPIHHTNEIAQSEGATGKKFVNYWLHVAFMKVNGKKMSKSLGNIYTLQDLIDRGYNPIAVRFFILSGHYRKELNFTFEALENASKTLNSIYSFMERVGDIANSSASGADPKFIREVKALRKAFFAALDDDFAMPEALAKLYSLISLSNRKIENGMSAKEAKAVIDVMLDFDTILGLDLSKRIEARKGLPPEVKELIEERNKARAERDYAKADEIRKIIKEKYNIVLEDSDQGTKWYYADGS